jgi:general stress protein 26
MTPTELMARAEAILETAKAGVLATVGPGEEARVRWLTPAIFPERTDRIYCLTTPESRKAGDIGARPHVEWMIQSPALTELVTLRGPMRLLEDETLRDEVFRAVNRRLTVFWRVHPGEQAYLVGETRIESGTYFRPMEGRREEVAFSDPAPSTAS